MFGLKAKELLGPADIQAPARLPVGFGGVPEDLSFKASLFGNHGGKIPNRHFLPCPQVDGQTTFIVLSCAKNAFCGILNIQKLSSRRSVSPQRECGLACFFRCDTFAY